MNGFIRILSWITCKLGWKVGNGLKIRLGVNPIVGLDASYILSLDLRDYLADYGISFLAQVHRQDGTSQGFNCWYSASDLDLGVTGMISGCLLSKVFLIVESRL